MENINWDAVSAIGSWLGAGATFLAAMLALYPYFKKIKLYFTINSNVDIGHALTIVNQSSNIVVIEKIQFFSGSVFCGDMFYEDNFIECQDDLVSDKTESYIEPYALKKVTYNYNRIIHDMTHTGYKYKVHKFCNLRIKIKTNLGDRVINTHIKTRFFLERTIGSSNCYRHYNVEDIIR